MDLFLPYMNIQRNDRPAFFDVLDFEKEFGQGATSSTPLFVDVGGSMGAQCVTFRQRYPNLPGRVILQDLGPVIEQVKGKPLPGFETVEAEAYDFFTPETIKGIFSQFSGRLPSFSPFLRTFPFLRLLLLFFFMRAKKAHAL